MGNKWRVGKGRPREIRFRIKIIRSKQGTENLFWQTEERNRIQKEGRGNKSKLRSTRASVDSYGTLNNLSLQPQVRLLVCAHLYLNLKYFLFGISTERWHKENSN